MSSREQKLIDIMFELVLTQPRVMKDRSSEELAEWIQYNLAECGFYTMPCGLSWGILVNEKDFKPNYHVTNTNNPIDFPEE